MAAQNKGWAEWWAGQDAAARKAAMAAADKGRDERWAGLDEPARLKAVAHLHEARRRKQQFLPSELLAMATEVNPRDPGRRTYEASCAWMPWVLAYNERARVTEAGRW